MQKHSVTRLDERTAAAIAEVRARTRSTLAKWTQRVTMVVGAAALAGAVAAPLWQRRWLGIAAAMGGLWLTVDQYYRVKGDITAGRGRWTSTALAVFVISELAWRGSDTLFKIGLGVVPALFALAMFVDAWNRPRAYPNAPRRMAAVTVFGLGAIATGLLYSIGDVLPITTWRASFFGCIGLLGAGAAMMYFDRRRKEQRVLWERKAS